MKILIKILISVLLITGIVCLTLWFTKSSSKPDPSNNNITLTVDKLIERLDDDMTLADPVNQGHVRHYISIYNRRIIEYLIDNIDRGMALTIYPDQQEGHDFFRIKPYDDIHRYELGIEETQITHQDKEKVTYTTPVYSRRSGFSTGIYVRGSRAIEQILDETYPSDFFICTILHEKLWYYSPVDSEPHKLYFIMSLISAKGELYWDWRSSDIVFKDIKAYLRIYTTYENWPTLRMQVYRRLHGYTSQWVRREPDSLTYAGRGWISAQDRDELLRIADEQGYEAAVSFLRKRLGREETTTGIISEDTKAKGSS